MKKSMTSKKPDISIIVSCYKGGKMLPVCLNSLINQSLINIEIICINDGSPDNTLEVIKNFAAKDDRIVVVNNKQNIGISKSRNKGIQLAKADLIMFCDADDYYEPQMCEAMLGAIIDSKADIAISEINVIYEAHEEMRYSDDNYYSLKYSGLQAVNEDLILNTDLSPTNKIFKKDILTNNKIRFPEDLYYEDAFFCSAYLSCCKSAYYLNERLYNYIRHEKSTMSNTWSDDKEKDPAIDHLYIAFELFDFLERSGRIDKYNNLYWKLFLSFELFSINNSKSANRRKEIKSKASHFITKHSKSFSKIETPTKEEILSINSAGLRINIPKVKKMLINVMPTYRMEVSNVQRLRSLKNNVKQSRERVDSLLEKIS